MTRPELIAHLAELDAWFARKPAGWLLTATPGQEQQWSDRCTERAAILARLERMG